jgi:hypothetical protein
MNKFNDTYKQIVSEDESLDRLNQQQIEKKEEYKSNIDREDPDVYDILEMYEEVGMSADMGLNSLFDSITDMIAKEVRPQHQKKVRVAVRQMWREKLNDFMRADW